MNVHPLIEIAEAMPIDGDPNGLLKMAAAQSWAATKTTRDQMAVVSAMTLAEWILAKRIEAHSTAKLFPLPPSTKGPFTVRAKAPKIRETPR